MGKNPGSLVSKTTRNDSFGGRTSLTFAPRAHIADILLRVRVFKHGGLNKQVVLINFALKNEPGHMRASLIVTFACFVSRGGIVFSAQDDGSRRNSSGITLNPTLQA